MTIYHYSPTLAAITIIMFAMSCLLTKAWINGNALGIGFTTGLLVITHASFHALGEWDYFNNAGFAALSFKKLKPPVGFFGHTHVPGLWRASDMQWIEPPLGRPFKLKQSDKYLINPGSVGNPRTPSNKPDSRAQYLIYDDERATVTFHRVKYDIKSCIAAIRKAGLPEEMESRIELGY